MGTRDQLNLHTLLAGNEFAQAITENNVDVSQKMRNSQRSTPIIAHYSEVGNELRCVWENTLNQGAQGQARQPGNSITKLVRCMKYTSNLSTQEAEVEGSLSPSWAENDRLPGLHSESLFLINLPL